ncbi:MAG TPA: class I SAM-dependent methyltransferase [Pyrinomonadaceae bacterium]|nr:class I SAM-dependent methyltransferase [Pyrinomonadaceae bacterium]
MRFLKDIFLKFSAKARQKRAEIFRTSFKVSPSTTILDLGSEDGSNIKSVIQGLDYAPEKVILADLDLEIVKRGWSQHNFRAVVIDENARLPFRDKAFEIVYCSSVIEHTTVPKDIVWQLADTKSFAEQSFRRQAALADEIRRVGKSYFVQTPIWSFPIESHSWLPFLSYMPRPLLLKILKLSNRFWIKKTIPDFNLLSRSQMQKLFPEATIITEKAFGMDKSVIAVYLSDDK